ncbi:MAG: PIN domain-containing protein [Candidatus Daviesbacteria bacterium]|nr:PIN domain-containing protein [Candidatus Daviesbacteria bacterium]
MLIKVFLDSDVVISSLISQKGAAYFLIQEKINLKLIISNISQEELSRVAIKLSIGQDKTSKLIKEKLKVIQIRKKSEHLKKIFGDYVTDLNDAHIIAGAEKAKVRFLISYNIKHFQIDKIKQDFNIIVTTPANFLQYLRSLKKYC